MQVFLGCCLPVLLLLISFAHAASFYLYWEPHQEADDCIEMGLGSPTEPPEFNPQLPLVLFIFGYLGDLYSPVTVAVREAHLSRQPVNFIVVDWSYATKELYGTALEAVLEVGSDTGDFLVGLCDRHGIRLRDVHIVGFSLGGHVAGAVSRRLNGQVGSIAALDPPICRLPQHLAEHERLSAGDAHYVQVIHTSRFISGDQPMGHADFFVDFHDVQPLCALDLSCAHGMSWKYYVETLQDNRLIEGRPCEVRGRRGTCRVIKGKWPVRMGGYPLDDTVRGMFAVQLRRRIEVELNL